MRNNGGKDSKETDGNRRNHLMSSLVFYPIAEEEGEERKKRMKRRKRRGRRKRRCEFPSNSKKAARQFSDQLKLFLD